MDFSVHPLTKLVGMLRTLCLGILFVGWLTGSAQPFTLDTTFKPSYAFAHASLKNTTGSVYDIIEEEDGKLMIYGAFKDEAPGVPDKVIRLNPDGSLDPTWTFSVPVEDGLFIGHKFEDQYTLGNGGGMIETDLSGKLLHPGSMLDPFNVIPRDSGFYCGLTSPAYFFEDGSFLVGASGCKFPNSTTPVRFLEFMKVDSAGYVDTSFVHTPDFSIMDIIEYDSTRLLLYSWWMEKYDGVKVNNICRIFKDGSIDTTFQVDSQFIRTGRPLVVQEDGKIIIGAFWITLTDRSDTLALLRLHPNGSIDTTFEMIPAKKYQPDYYSGFIYSGFNYGCTTSDGGLLLGGQFDEYQGVSRYNIVKTDEHGNIDLRYFNGAGIDSTIGTWYPAGISRIVPGQNDTYYVMGNFLMFDDQPVKPIIRLLGLSHTVGLEEEIKPKLVKVFPNPAIDEVTFEWEEFPGHDPVTIRLYDLQGRLLGEYRPPAVATAYTIRLPEISGTLVYEVEREGVVERGKLVVRK